MIEGIGWGAGEPGATLLCESPNDIYIDQWYYQLLDAIESTGARRLVIDSLGDLAAACPDDKRFREFVYSLLNRCSRAGVSTLITFESPDLYGQTRLSERGAATVRRPTNSRSPAMAYTSGNPSIQFDARCDHGDPPTVHVSGEIDLASRDRLIALLDEVARPGRDLIIDCAGIEFIDASGISALLHAANVIGDGRLRLKGVHGVLAEILDILDLAAAVPNLRPEPR